MLIGAVIAFVGSIGAFALVRQRDFVPSYRPPAPCGVDRGGSPVSATAATGGRGPSRPASGSADRRVRGPGVHATSERVGHPDAALRQLAELGYARVSMESVACEAGVARATIYRRYRTRPTWSPRPSPATARPTCADPSVIPVPT